MFGPTGGLGAEFCRQFVERGYQVIPVRRSECDLASPSSVAAWLEIYGKKCPKDGHEVVVFAAGHSELGYLEDVDPAAIDRCMRINFLSVVHIFLNLVKGHSERTFVFLHSGVGEFLMPGLAPLSLAHRSLRDFLYIWRMENKNSRARVLSVWPGKVATRFNEKTVVHGRLPKPRANPAGAAPEAVVNDILAALSGGQSTFRRAHLPTCVGRVQSLFPALVAYLLKARPR